MLRHPGTEKLPFSKSGSLPIDRRNILKSASYVSTFFIAGAIGDSDSIAHAYTIRKGYPDEVRIYKIAQSFRPTIKKGNASALRILWIGAGDLKGAFKNLFLPGNEVLALDLVVPADESIYAAKVYAKEHDYQLDFEQGDGTKLRFEDGSFDVVLSTQFLCQDFDPQVVVREIYRVLKPGGRFGYYEDEEEIDKIIVGKVFGPDSVIEFEYDPIKSNIIAGVVKKRKRRS